MAGGVQGRTTYRFRQLAAALRREQRPCWLCGQPIDYTATKDEPDSFTVDHIQPRSTHPDLAEVWSNLEAAHSRCNKGRGDRPPSPGLGVTSRQW